MNRSLTAFISLLLILLAGLISSCHVGKVLWYNFADIKDYRIFPENTLKASDKPFKFFEGKNQEALKTISYGDFANMNTDSFFRKTNTVAFLIIRNDSILFEKYYNEYDHKSIVPSFSMAKSFTSALVGCAIADGYIKSVKQSVREYVPELHPDFDGLSIEQVLQMTSGIKSNESYFNPFSGAAKIYYGNNLRKTVKHLRLKTKPGTNFEYQSINTELLGLVLERALKNKSITEYLQEKIWTPLQMEYDAGWSIDSKRSKLEKTFCCINARARDYAKFGRLFLNQGKWNGQQIIPSDWVNCCTKPKTENGSVWYYQYQWWLASKDNGDFYANGFLGQYIYVNPKNNIVMVRLGKNHGKVRWISLMKQLSAQL